jgi:phosphoribosylaminoimidazole (AIR) synthetase
MGLGMMVVVPSNHVEMAQEVLPEDLFVVGKIVSGKSGVRIV